MLLDRLSVFAGGFDLPAAEAICGTDPLVSEDVVDLLSSLVDKSLVMVEQGEGASRYGLLETIREFAREHLSKRYDLLGTIREFAAEHLVDRGDVAATAARHCDYYLGIAKSARAHLEGSEQAEWTRRLEVELDNLRAAIALALAEGVDPVLAVKFEVALMRFRILRGYSTEARNNVRKALVLPGIREPNAARGHALYVGGGLATNQSDYGEATRMLTECLAIRRGLDTPRETGATLSTLATLHLQQDDTAKAHDYEVEAIGIFRDIGDRVGEGVGLLNLGEISLRQGDADSAEDLFEQSLALAKDVKHQELEAECERNLGELALSAGDLQAARARLARSLKVCRDAEDKRGEAIALWRLGKTDAACGDQESARKRLAEALRAILDKHHQALPLQLAGQIESAVRAYAAGGAIRETLALPRPPHREAELQTRLKAARAVLGERSFDIAWRTGRAWSLGEAIERALASAAVSPVTA